MSVDFKKLVSEVGYVRARRVLQTNQLKAAQRRVDKEDDAVAQRNQAIRFTEAVKLSSTLGEPLVIEDRVMIMKEEKRKGVEEEMVGEEKEALRGQSSALAHAFQQSLLLPDCKFYCVQAEQSELPAGFGSTLFAQLGDLQTLHYQRNLLPSLLSASLPQFSMYKLQHLKMLNLSGNKLTSLPSDIGVLLQLQKLDVSFNMISTFPSSFGSLKSLLQLNLSNNNFSILDPSFLSLTQLTHLNLSNNLVVNLPYEVSHLGRLKQLDLSSNSLFELAFYPPLLQPADLWKLQMKTDSSQSTPLYRNIFTKEIVSDIYSYSSNAIRGIEYLHVFQPPKTKAYSLRRKWLSICQVQEWESVLDVSSGWRYYRNNVSGKSTWTLPKSIDKLGRLLQLDVLNLSSNKLRSLPTSLTELRSLKKLILSRNRISHLPKDFGNLLCLQDLHLQFNELKLLPSSIVNCNWLEELNIQGNKLTRLPDNLGHMRSIRKVFTGRKIFICLFLTKLIYVYFYCAI